MAECVYFMQSEADGLVKIGFTSNLSARRAAIQHIAGSKVRVLRTIPGGRDKEKRIHMALARFRVKGEWFTPDPEVIQYDESKYANRKQKCVRFVAASPIEARQERGLSIHDASIGLGCTESDLAAIEQGQSAPSLALLLAMLELYQVPDSAGVALARYWEAP